MQSPLTPQRGRIESNPREYTHMGPRLCGELETMPADWAKALRDRRASVDIRTHERGFSDRPKILTHVAATKIRLPAPA